jgi:hypothetical protein
MANRSKASLKKLDQNGILDPIRKTIKLFSTATKYHGKNAQTQVVTYFICSMRGRAAERVAVNVCGKALGVE